MDGVSAALVRIILPSAPAILAKALVLAAEASIPAQIVFDYWQVVVIFTQAAAILLWCRVRLLPRPGYPAPPRRRTGSRIRRPLLRHLLVRILGFLMVKF